MKLWDKYGGILTTIAMAFVFLYVGAKVFDAIDNQQDISTMYLDECVNESEEVTMISTNSSNVVKWQEYCRDAKLLRATTQSAYNDQPFALLGVAMVLVAGIFIVGFMAQG